MEQGLVVRGWTGRNDPFDEWGLPLGPEGSLAIVIPGRERPYYQPECHVPCSGPRLVSQLLRKFANRPELRALEKYAKALAENGKIAPCCRDAANHHVSAWYSSQAESLHKPEAYAQALLAGFGGSWDDYRRLTVVRPDVYVFHCACGRDHRRFCVGRQDHPGSPGKYEPRPLW